MRAPHNFTNQSLILFALLSVFIFILGVSACSLKQKEPTIAISASFKPISNQKSQSLTDLGPIGGQIDCYVANIMGQEIASLESSPTEIQKKDELLANAFRGKACAYPGLISGPLTAAQLEAGEKFNFEIKPSSFSLRVQIIGISDPDNTFCSSGPITRENWDEVSFSAWTEAYQMGAANLKVDAFDTSKEITITNQFATLTDSEKQERQINRATCKYSDEKLAARVDPILSLSAMPSSYDPDCIEITATASNPGSTSKNASVTSPYYSDAETPGLATGSWYLYSACSIEMSLTDTTYTTYSATDRVELATRGPNNSGAPIGIRRTFKFLPVDCTESICSKTLYFKTSNPHGKDKTVFTMYGHEDPDSPLTDPYLYSTHHTRLVLDLN